MESGVLSQRDNPSEKGLKEGIYTTSHTYYRNEGAKGLPQTIKFNKKSRRCTVGVFFAKYSFLLKVKAS